VRRPGSFLWFDRSLLLALIVTTALYIVSVLVGAVQGEYLRQLTVLAVVLGALLARWRQGLGWLMAIIGMLSTAELLLIRAASILYPDGIVHLEQPGGDLTRLAEFQPLFALHLVAMLLATGMATRLAAGVTRHRAILLVGIALMVVVLIVGSITLVTGDWMTYAVLVTMPVVWTLGWPVFILLGIAATLWATGVATRVRRQGVSSHGPDRLPAIREALLAELVPAFAGAQRSGAAKERAWFATELHASVLPAIRSAAKSADPSSTDQPDVRARLIQLEGELRRIAEGKRNIVLDEFGLVEALEGLVERVQQDHDIPVGLMVEGDTDPGRAPRRVEQAAFDICRLALDNAAIHSGPTEIQVTIATSPNHVRLEIADDGRGLHADEVESARRAGRHGVPDMRQAAQSVSGRLVVEPATTTGTRVIFEWGRR
jgi:signal transduction histidine kinase